jgi:lipopolysaccharide biosynthesis glycosyltransferase
MPSPRAVVTASVGQAFSEMGRITQPLMKGYANRCSADFVVISEPLMATRNGLPARYEKFQLFDLLNRYERVLFLDNDILVTPDAPDVFELVAPDRFAASSELGFSRVALDLELTQKVLGELDWREPYFNTGVMVASKRHRELFDPSRAELHQWNAFSGSDSRYHPAGEDQAFLNYLVNALNVPFLDLGFRFNHTRVRTDTHRRFHSHFIHYAGPSGFRYGTRLEQMRKDAHLLNNPLSLSLARTFPRLRWVLDRCDPAFVSYLFARMNRKPA